jgi:hypothetical protein
MELRVGGSVIEYAAVQLSNGIGPEEARECALEAAAQLSMLALALRKSVRLPRGQRRLLVARLSGLGYTREAIALRAGVSVKTVGRDLAGGPRRRSGWPERADDRPLFDGPGTSSRQ